jgi:hypothetical protein
VKDEGKGMRLMRVRCVVEHHNQRREERTRDERGEKRGRGEEGREERERGARVKVKTRATRVNRLSKPGLLTLELSGLKGRASGVCQIKGMSPAVTNMTANMTPSGPHHFILLTSHFSPHLR